MPGDVVLQLIDHRMELHCAGIEPDTGGTLFDPSGHLPGVRRSAINPVFVRTLRLHRR